MICFSGWALCETRPLLDLLFSALIPLLLLCFFVILKFSGVRLMFAGMGGFVSGSFWAATEPVLTFPSPGCPGYDLNDDAKMYMQAMVL